MRITPQNLACQRLAPLILATRNLGKIQELAAPLAAHGFAVQLPPVDILDIAETGITFAENAALKAIGMAKATGLPALADDSGLEVDALGGAPGVFSARFSEDLPFLPGENKDQRNIRKLLSAIEAVPAPRSARFQCCMALAYPEDAQPTIIAQAAWEGSIAAEPRGAHGFGYDPVFIDLESKLRAAELTPEQKLARSHRGKALRILLAELERLTSINTCQKTDKRF